MQPKKITTEAENERILKILDPLMRNQDLPVEELMLVELLVSLVEEFEKDFYKFDDEPMDPLDMLKSLMADQKMEVGDLAKLLGSPSRATEILQGKRGISKAQARILGDRFCMEPSAFLKL